tara:strand:- start:380 stop:580 length:201 start_codon:yes stop_codon:yes gene_type:complete
MSEEYIVHNDAIYKKVTDLNALVKHCKFCDKAFYTREQRKIYCSVSCKSKAWRKSQKCETKQEIIR